MRRLKNGLAWLGILAVLGAIAFVYFDIEIYRKESVTKAFSAFVSLQPANEYVITKLSNAETFELHEVHWVLENYPVGDTKASITIPATYNYYIKPQELSFRLEDETLFVDVGALYLQTPVGFNTEGVSVSGEKNWFGRAVGLVLDELNKSVSSELEKRGKQHLPLVRKQASEALAMNIHEFLQKIGQEDFYKEIVIQFSDVDSEVSQHFQFESKTKVQFPVGDRLILIQ